MTDPASKTSLRKRPAATSAAPAGGTAPAGAKGDVPKSLPLPLTINLACLALVLTAVLDVANALSLRGFTSQLKAYLIHHNATASKPDKNYDVDKALAQVRTGSLIQALVFVVVFALLVFAIRRTRSASGSRWALLVVVVFTGLPFSIVPGKGLPVLPQTLGVLDGVSAIAALVLVFAPAASRAYFKACREAALPPERRGQARPGLGSLFAPRRPAAGGGTGGFAGRGARTAPPTRPVAKDAGAAPRSRSKVRADTDSVARGADLARARAKASKSRRTAD